MFRLSTSAIIKQDTGSKVGKTEAASPCKQWVENI
jgi:hypothetical protein